MNLILFLIATICSHIRGAGEEAVPPLHAFEKDARYPVAFLFQSTKTHETSNWSKFTSFFLRSTAPPSHGAFLAAFKIQDRTGLTANFDGERGKYEITMALESPHFCLFSGKNSDQLGVWVDSFDPTPENLAKSCEDLGHTEGHSLDFTSSSIYHNNATFRFDPAPEEVVVTASTMLVDLGSEFDIECVVDLARFGNNFDIIPDTFHCELTRYQGEGGPKGQLRVSFGEESIEGNKFPKIPSPQKFSDAFWRNEWKERMEEELEPMFENYVDREMFETASKATTEVQEHYGQLKAECEETVRNFSQNMQKRSESLEEFINAQKAEANLILEEQIQAVDGMAGMLDRDVSEGHHPLSELPEPPEARRAGEPLVVETILGELEMLAREYREEVAKYELVVTEGLSAQMEAIGEAYTKKVGRTWCLINYLIGSYGDQNPLPENFEETDDFSGFDGAYTGLEHKTPEHVIWYKGAVNIQTIFKKMNIERNRQEMLSQRMMETLRDVGSALIKRKAEEMINQRIELVRLVLMNEHYLVRLPMRINHKIEEWNTTLQTETTELVEYLDEQRQHATANYPSSWDKAIEDAEKERDALRKDFTLTKLREINTLAEYRTLYNESKSDHEAWVKRHPQYNKENERGKVEPYFKLDIRDNDDVRADMNRFRREPDVLDYDVGMNVEELREKRQETYTSPEIDLDELLDLGAEEFELRERQRSLDLTQAILESLEQIRHLENQKAEMEQEVAELRSELESSNGMHEGRQARLQELTEQVELLENQKGAYESTIQRFETDHPDIALTDEEKDGHPVDDTPEAIQRLLSIRMEFKKYQADLQQIEFITRSARETSRVAVEENNLKQAELLSLKNEVDKYRRILDSQMKKAAGDGSSGEGKGKTDEDEEDPADMAAREAKDLAAKQMAAKKKTAPSSKQGFLSDKRTRMIVGLSLGIGIPVLVIALIAGIYVAGSGSKE